MTESTKERLYSLLPAVYRARDFAEGEPLKALLNLVEGEMRLLEEDIEGLYDDWFIETCRDWVIPYIGDLLGVHAAHSLAAGGAKMRGYVANTIAYRRRKGTASVLEQVSRDVTGWSSHAVEFFQLLAVSQHLNHLRLERGRTAWVRNSDEMEMVNGPFETAAHTLDVRRITTRGGRYNIPNVGIFLWRLQSYPLVQTAAHRIGDEGNLYTFDPTGLEIPLFNRPQTEDQIVHLSEEINVPGPLRRRPLYRELEARRLGDHILPSYFDPNPALGVDIVFTGSTKLRRIPPEEIFICNMAEWRYPPSEPDVAITPLSGFEVEVGAYGQDYRPWLRGEVVEVFCDHMNDPGTSATILKAELDGGSWLLTLDEDVSTMETHNNLRIRRVTVAVDPERGRLTVSQEVSPQKVLVGYSYGFSGDVGAGPYDRTSSIREIMAGEVDWQVGVSQSLKEAGNSRGNSDDEVDNIFPDLESAVGEWTRQIDEWKELGVLDGKIGMIAVMDNRTYEEADLKITVPEGCQLLIVAADWLIPRSIGQFVARGLRPCISGEIELSEGTSPNFEGSSNYKKEPGELVIDGLLIEGKLKVKGGNPSLRVAHTTLVPIESPEENAGVGGIEVEDGCSTELTIERSICCGPIVMAGSASSLILRESIVDDAGIADYGINAENATAEIYRSTVLGKSLLRRLEADGSIFMGEVMVRLRQQGCVRFSYLPPESSSSRRFRCQPDLALAAKREALGRDLSLEERRAVKIRLRPAFTSFHYGDPGYSQLSLASAEEVRTGAEDGSEMGVFGFLEQPQREVNLRAALDEYIRFGLEAGIFYVT